MATRAEEIRLENVSIGRGPFRNFAGAKTQFNANGRRVFTMFLPEEVAETLKEEGWNVKTKDRPDRDDPDQMVRQYQLEAEVSYMNYPPNVVLVTSDGSKVHLNEENVGELDNVMIDRADVTLRPYNWDVNGRTGVKAYVKDLVVTERAPRRALNAGFTRVENDEDPF